MLDHSIMIRGLKRIWKTRSGRLSGTKTNKSNVPKSRIIEMDEIHEIDMAKSEDRLINFFQRKLNLEQEILRNRLMENV